MGPLLVHGRLIQTLVDVFSFECDQTERIAPMSWFAFSLSPSRLSLLEMFVPFGCHLPSPVRVLVSLESDTSVLFDVTILPPSAPLDSCVCFVLGCKMRYQR